MHPCAQHCQQAETAHGGRGDTAQHAGAGGGCPCAHAPMCTAAVSYVAIRQDSFFVISSCGTGWNVSDKTVRWGYMNRLHGLMNRLHGPSLLAA